MSRHSKESAFQSELIMFFSFDAPADFLVSFIFRGQNKWQSILFMDDKSLGVTAKIGNAYMDLRNPAELIDPILGRSIRTETVNSATTVIRNPSHEGAVRRDSEISRTDVWLR